MAWHWSWAEVWPPCSQLPHGWMQVLGHLGTMLCCSEVLWLLACTVYFSRCVREQVFSLSLISSSSNTEFNFISYSQHIQMATNCLLKQLLCLPNFPAYEWNHCFPRFPSWHCLSRTLFHLQPWPLEQWSVFRVSSVGWASFYCRLSLVQRSFHSADALLACWASCNECEPTVSFSPNCLTLFCRIINGLVIALWLLPTWSLPN